MKRLLALAVFLVAGAVAAGVAFADHGRGHGGKHHGAGKVVYVIEHATTDAVTNNDGRATDSVGDILTFTNDVFDRSNSHNVGSDQGYCVRMVVGESWECVWTTLLPGGQLTVEGPFYDTHDSVLAITGGTGAYANVRGSMELRWRAGGTEFAFIFHLIG
ncbi:MAG TPA: allene oxide cyclase family protein [Gaiellaceae bacterium]|nr:allene oxide cyclase family protein [Gaiellaceae bacterium]